MNFISIACGLVTLKNKNHIKFNVMKEIYMRLKNFRVNTFFIFQVGQLRSYFIVKFYSFHISLKSNRSGRKQHFSLQKSHPLLCHMTSTTYGYLRFDFSTKSERSFELVNFKIYFFLRVDPLSIGGEKVICFDQHSMDSLSGCFH